MRSLRRALVLVGLPLLNAVGPSVSAQLSTIGYDQAFELVVRSLAQDSAYRGAKGSLQVDVRPFRPDANTWQGQSPFATDAPEVAEDRRRAVLRELGMTVGDARFPVACAGVMVLDAPGEDSHRGCPRTSRVVAAIGLPQMRRPDGLLATDDPRAQIVRVVIAGIGPGGISAELRDYVLESSGQQWRVARVAKLGYLE